MSFEERVILSTGRTDIKPGEFFTHLGNTYRALTYPVGAKKEVMPGVYIEMGMVTDPENPDPVGSIAAEPVYYDSYGHVCSRVDLDYEGLFE